MNYLVLFSIIMISQKFILFNEEFLILLCFIGFICIFLENYSFYVSNYFKSINYKIENLIIDSYNQLLIIWDSQIQFNKNIFNVVTYFVYLKNYYFLFNSNIATKLKPLQDLKKHIIFKKKLQFSKGLEVQFLKLIILLLIVKIQKILLLNRFYSCVLDINSFKCINKICFREYLESI